MNYRSDNEMIPSVTTGEYEAFTENRAFLQWFNLVSIAASKAQRRTMQEDARNREYQAGYYRGLTDAINTVRDVRTKGINLVDSEIGKRAQSEKYAQTKLKEHLYGDE